MTFLFVTLLFLTGAEDVKFPEPYLGMSILMLAQIASNNLNEEDEGDQFNEVNRAAIVLGVPFQVKEITFEEMYPLKLMVFPEFNFSSTYVGAMFGFGPELIIPWSSYWQMGVFTDLSVGPYIGYILNSRDETAAPDSLLYGGYVGAAAGPYFSVYDKFRFRLRFDIKTLFGDFKKADIKSEYSGYSSLWLGGSFQVYF